MTKQRVRATHADVFVDRHIGLSLDAENAMLETLGYETVDALVRAAIPESIRDSGVRTSTIPPAASETEALADVRAFANRNVVRRSMIGCGYYGTITPAVLKRGVLDNPGWYTAYTPYQPEISQGRLEALITFQTMVTDLTGLAVANASMLDEGTAAVEAMLLARRACKKPCTRFIVDADVLPQTRALLASRARPLDIDLVEFDLRSREGAEPDSLADVFDGAFGVLVQYPGASGRVGNFAAIATAARLAGAATIVAADLLALALLVPPGEFGADIAVGTTQRFGVPMGFGGPHAGYLAVRTGLERELPGRLVGVSCDVDGNRAYRLSLQAREQHIRREKATSNICTAQVLLAVMAAMFAVYHGPAGIRRIARRVHEAASEFGAELVAAGFELESHEFFDTIRVRVPGRARAIEEDAHAANIAIHRVDDDTIGLSFDEVLTEDAAKKSLRRDLQRIFGITRGEGKRARCALPERAVRKTPILAHPVFTTHHSETSMMRFVKRLADADYSLDRGMIPLGSCTMKLNGAAEMEPITWPEFANVHPFAPANDVRGYLDLIRELENWLADVTGYDAVSMQPNAGSQGELAGLLAIRAYHRARGEGNRRVCLIPSSAHGTNAASAVLAGMRVVVVECDESGNVDRAALDAAVSAHARELAALMITYPSTHGVYEHDIAAMTEAVHDAGGQVYVDGANLNALLGYARFGKFGGDVSHLNLHKTFCIPHGGGGPGVGPVAAKAHLAPYLPGHEYAQREENRGAPVSSAPFGAPSILPISWAYIRMMGAEGLKRATGAAVLSANYVAARLREHFPVLYTGDSGLVAHECILDLRPLTQQTGVTVDDVAKRLIDYGFHAPTMSFPVPGTLMVEPTESEDIAEVDRFIDAMIAIKTEANAVGDGVWPADDNPLRNAPHTAKMIATEQWSHPYSRECAVYPVPSLVRNKYWPPVRRVDQAWGDRNLVCACPPPEAFL